MQTIEMKTKLKCTFYHPACNFNGFTKWRKKAKIKTNSKSRFQLHAIKEAPQVMMRIIFSVFN